MINLDKEECLRFFLYESNMEMIIGGKKVFIFENHAEAIIPWALLSESQKKLPYLISLDHHTDTHLAFHSYASYMHIKNKREYEDERNSFLKDFDKNNCKGLFNASKLLNNDEQIDFAIQKNIISHSFSIISGVDNYLDNSSKMSVVQHNCFEGFTKKPHDDECGIEFSNQVIENIYLEDQLEKMAIISKNKNLGDLSDNKYILDIDLDYFRTNKSVHPKNISTFYKLIKESIGITIAKESKFVQYCKIKGEKIDSDYLLYAILDHVNKATK